MSCHTNSGECVYIWTDSSIWMRIQLVLQTPWISIPTIEVGELMAYGLAWRHSLNVFPFRCHSGMRQMPLTKFLHFETRLREITKGQVKRNGWLYLTVYHWDNQHKINFGGTAAWICVHGCNPLDSHLHCHATGIQSIDWLVGTSWSRSKWHTTMY